MSLMGVGAEQRCVFRAVLEYIFSAVSSRQLFSSRKDIFSAVLISRLKVLKIWADGKVSNTSQGCARQQCELDSGPISEILCDIKKTHAETELLFFKTFKQP